MQQWVMQQCVGRYHGKKHYSTSFNSLKWRGNDKKERLQRKLELYSLLLVKFDKIFFEDLMIETLKLCFRIEYTFAFLVLWFLITTSWKYSKEISLSLILWGTPFARQVRMFDLFSVKMGKCARFSSGIVVIMYCLFYVWEVGKKKKRNKKK